MTTSTSHSVDSFEDIGRTEARNLNYFDLNHVEKIMFNQ